LVIVPALAMSPILPQDPTDQPILLLSIPLLQKRLYLPLYVNYQVSS